MVFSVSKWFLSWIIAAFFAVTLHPAIAQTSASPPADAGVSESITAIGEAKDPNTSLAKIAIVVVALTAPELSDVADFWQKQLRGQLEETMRINLEIERAGLEMTGLRDELAEKTVRTKEISDIYGQVLTAWELKGGSQEDIKPHKDYLNASQWEFARKLDFATLIGLALAWIISWNGGLWFLSRIFGFLLAVWAMLFIARLITRIANRGLKSIESISKLLTDFILKAVYWATFAVGIIFALGFFGVNITPALAIFGGVSFILGFALQETLGNLASGIMLMVYKPFDLEDYVLVGGKTGYVDHMSVVSTRIRTLDNQFITVPNSKIWGDIITNFTASRLRRVDLVFGIRYSDDTELAIKELHELITKHPKCLKEPEAQVFVGELGDNSVNIFCRPWVNPDDYLSVSWDLTGQAKQRFDEVGISIPFPQRDIHIYQEQPSND